jgi:hypothetical protein
MIIRTKGGEYEGKNALALLDFLGVKQNTEGPQ